MRHNKIAIIGSGYVGSTIAYALMMRNVGSEILLTDIDEQRSAGEVHDLNDALGFSHLESIKTATLQEAAQASIIIVTAGAAQKPGETRIDLAAKNYEIVRHIIEQMQPINPNAIMLMVTNPVDLMTLATQEFSGLPRNQVFGSGTFLDTQRLRNLISQKLNIAEVSIHAYILGEHGDSQFPAWSLANVNGISLSNFTAIHPNDLDMIAEQTQKKAYTIIKEKKATYFGIGACAAAICGYIVHNKRRALPLSVYQEKWDICLSVPVIIGETGIIQQLPIDLNKDEQQKLQASAERLAQIYQQIKK
jgi:L-lactate dehydrogenase